MHIAIDDATRLAYAEVLTDEKATTAIAFLRRAIAFFSATACRSASCSTDNGSPYRSAVHAIACRPLGIRHLRTRPLPAPDQRQGRALHPHHARRLGLRRDLRDKHRAHRSP